MVWGFVCFCLVGFDLLVGVCIFLSKHTGLVQHWSHGATQVHFENI